MKHSGRVLLPAAVLAFLSGCSPHPGAGTWAAAGESRRDFSKLEVQFEARATLYLSGQGKGALRCFWAGKSAESIGLDCNPAGNTGPKRIFSLVVTGEDQAQLMESGKVVAKFQRVRE